MELRGTLRGGASVVRRLPPLARGTYRVNLWVKGRVGLAVGRDASHPGLGRASARRWLPVAATIRVPRATRGSSLTLWVARNSAAMVDDVTLIRDAIGRPARRAEALRRVPPQGRL